MTEEIKPPTVYIIGRAHPETGKMEWMCGFGDYPDCYSDYHYEAAMYDDPLRALEHANEEHGEKVYEYDMAEGKLKPYFE